MNEIGLDAGPPSSPAPSNTAIAGVARSVVAARRFRQALIATELTARANSKRNLPPAMISIAANCGLAAAAATTVRTAYCPVISPNFTVVSATRPWVDGRRQISRAFSPT